MIKGILSNALELVHLVVVALIQQDGFSFNRNRVRILLGDAA